MNFKTIKSHVLSPNFITEIRIGAIPAVMFLLGWNNVVLNSIGATVFLFVSFTDIADGIMARRMNKVSNTGKLLDPLADKLLAMAALIMLIPLDRVPPWLVVLLIGRELTVTGIRSIAASDGLVIAAEAYGKWKSVFMTAGLTGLILGPEFPLFEVNWATIGMGLLLLGTVFSIWSSIQYIKTYYAHRKTQ